MAIRRRQTLQFILGITYNIFSLSENLKMRFIDSLNKMDNGVLYKIKI